MAKINHFLTEYSLVTSSFSTAFVVSRYPVWLSRSASFSTRLDIRLLKIDQQAHLCRLISLR